jgi:hypothetical protein
MNSNRLRGYGDPGPCARALSRQALLSHQPSWAESGIDPTFDKAHFQPPLQSGRGKPKTPEPTGKIDSGPTAVFCVGMRLARGRRNTGRIRDS